MQRVFLVIMFLLAASVWNLLRAESADGTFTIRELCSGIIVNKAKVYALLVGFDGCVNGFNTFKLVDAVGDVRDLNKVLSQQGYSVKCLTKAAACRDSIFPWFKRLCDSCGYDDRIFFYFSGHGTILSQVDVLTDCARKLPVKFAVVVAPSTPKNSCDYISGDEIATMFKRCKAREKVIIIDACESNKARAPDLAIDSLYDPELPDPSVFLLTTYGLALPKTLTQSFIRGFMGQDGCVGTGNYKGKVRGCDIKRYLDNKFGAENIDFNVRIQMSGDSNMVFSNWRPNRKCYHE
jgi:hypothetical protein